MIGIIGDCLLCLDGRHIMVCVGQPDLSFRKSIGRNGLA